MVYSGDGSPMDAAHSTCTCYLTAVVSALSVVHPAIIQYCPEVTGATSTTPVSAPQPPVYCHDTPSKCTQGAKQMIFVYQQDGNNVNVPPGAVEQLAPGYSMKNGFAPGAQDDIFVTTIATGGTNYDEPSVHQTELATVSPIEQNEDRPRRPLRFARDLVIFPDHEHDPSPTPTSSAVVSESPTSTLSSTSSETGIPMYPVATPPPPSSKSDKIVVAHVVVGNTYVSSIPLALYTVTTTLCDTSHTQKTTGSAISFLPPLKASMPLF